MVSTMENDIKLDPECLKGGYPGSPHGGLTMMVTNTGHLMPCAQLNVGDGIRDPEIQELMKYTKISDYDSLDDIISHPKWIEHFENLKKNIAPDRCFYCCKADNNFSKQSQWTITDLDGNETNESNEL